MMNSVSIAITGLGAITPFGEGVPAFWDALLQGKSAISDCDRFDLAGLSCTKAGLVRFVPSRPEVTPASRAHAFAAAACQEALGMANLSDDDPRCKEVSLITASNFGDMESLEDAMRSGQHFNATAKGFSACIHASLADQLAERFRLGGIRIAHSLSCASGASAIATAANLIQAGQATRFIIVAYDVITPYAWCGLCSLRTMTREQIRPFDLNRSGTIFAEGAAAIVLEAVTPETNPQALAYLTGWATGNNGFHLTAPAPRGAGSSYVMREALKRAGLSPDQIDHINAHGTATQPNDQTETEAVYDTFGQRASSIPVTSVKGSLGHLLGAAGAIEVIASVLSLQHQLIPPTSHHETPDPACALDIVKSPREWTLNHVLSNSAGFGGCNAAVILSKQPSGPISLHPAVPLNHASIRNSDPAPVYIAGIGAICSLGADIPEIEIALREGEPGLAPLTRFDLPEERTVGEAPPVDLLHCGVSQKTYLDHASVLFLAATGQAFSSAGLNADQTDRPVIGTVAGTAYGCLTTCELFYADYLAKGPRLVKPMLFPHSYANTPVSLVAMEWSLTGEHDNIVSEEIASGVALVEAFHLLASGRADTLMTGGVDVLSRVRLLEPATSACVAPGEAAAALLLTSTPSQTPCARILGAAMAPSLDTALNNLRAQTDLNPEQIDRIFANSTAQREAEKHFPHHTIDTPATLCGEVGGAATALHLCLALCTPEIKTALILTANASTAVAVLITRA